MIMADVWKIVFLILGTQAVMVSYWLLAAALFPEALRRSRAAYDQRSGRLTVVGLVDGRSPSLLIGGGAPPAGPAPNAQAARGGPREHAGGPRAWSVRPGSATASAPACPGDADARLPWRRVLRGGHRAVVRVRAARHRVVRAAAVDARERRRRIVRCAAPLTGLARTSGTRRRAPPPPSVEAIR